MTDKQRLWLDEIREESSRQAEEDEMDDQPTGATIVWGAACVLVWVAVIALVYFGLIR